jgi:hypothetical protein
VKRGHGSGWCGAMDEFDGIMMPRNHAARYGPDGDGPNGPGAAEAERRRALYFGRPERQRSRL